LKIEEFYDKRVMVHNGKTNPKKANKRCK
jgi:hypothetical protein